MDPQGVGCRALCWLQDGSKIASEPGDPQRPQNEPKRALKGPPKASTLPPEVAPEGPGMNPQLAYLRTYFPKQKANINRKQGRQKGDPL